jgi:Sulfotransferase family
VALIDRPIIIIGAGRSGTSLLDASLGAHPEIAMQGEFGGTVALLWRCFWEASSAEAARTRRIAARRAAAPEPAEASEAQIFAHVRELEREERQQAAEIIRDSLDRLYGIAAARERYWGYKEIWAEQALWPGEDAVFPEAFYVHIIRHPFDYARSYTDWRRLALTSAQLQEDLGCWLAYHRANRARAATGRYLSFTYEALIADPPATLAPLFDRFGLAWDQACAAAFARRWAEAGFASPWPAGLAAARAAVPGLAEAMAELGYDLPPEPIAASLPPPPPAIEPGRWLLAPPFHPDQGPAFTARLDQSPAFRGFEAEADTLEAPYRSRLLLEEDGVVLGPAHSLHAAIRQQGRGRFSHWGPRQILLFSTSDNSDPNRNGRVYTLRLDDLRG